MYIHVYGSKKRQQKSEDLTGGSLIITTIFEKTASFNLISAFYIIQTRYIYYCVFLKKKRISSSNIINVEICSEMPFGLIGEEQHTEFTSYKPSTHQ